MNQQVLDMQSKAIEQMKSMQAQTIEFNERIAEMLPEMPELPASFTEKLPKPAEVVTNYFDFVAQLQTANREFAQAMVATWFPAEGKAKAKTTKK